jgi:hypothetical protein
MLFHEFRCTNISNKIMHNFNINIKRYKMLRMKMIIAIYRKIKSKKQNVLRKRKEIDISLKLCELVRLIN